ncbi:MAG TPA: Gfo/Idh/MocA family oxidoreductase [Solirubrobacteraceae bacterium]|nr:Gfo/Idh/MocA family oxidoreductase [Solirubrobacteraceae bacterium]
MSAPVNIGLIGLGQISVAHVEGYRRSPHVNIAAVCDVDGQRADASATELDVKAYTDYRELLAESAIDAVDVILPHNLHHGVVGDALDAGKHVIVEKPLALTHDDCVDLIDRARDAGLTLSVEENTRFVAAYVEVQRMLEAGTLGEIRLIRTIISGSEVSRLRNTSLWKGRKDGSGGGAIIDAGPHSFYLLKWLFGEIATVRAFHDRLIDEAQVEDNGVVAGRLASGALFRCEFTFTAEVPWGERLEVYGSEGTVIVDQLLDPPAVHIRCNQDYDRVALEGVPFNPQGWKRESIAVCVEQFAAALAEHRPPPVDAGDGAYGVLVSERAYASAAQGGVELELAAALS